MSRHLDVVNLTGDEYDRLMDEREILRQEASRAWREVDAIARERDEHLHWRKELAGKLHGAEAELAQARALLQTFQQRDWHRGTLLLDSEDKCNIDAALAKEQT